MPHINITASSSGSNAGSCGQLVEYLEKENNRQAALLKAKHKAELWFNQGRDDVHAQEVRLGLIPIPPSWSNRKLSSI